MAAQTLTATLDGVAAWVEETIAPELEYLVPPSDGAVDGITPEWDNPSVFQAFVPSVERLPEGAHQAPSIAVQLLNGNDEIKGVRELSVRLVLTIWSPGHFEEDGAFVRDSEGWRELFSGLGVIAGLVEAAETIADCAVVLSDGVQFGFLEIDKEIPDLYPFWMGKVDFKLRRAPHANKRFQDML